MKVYVVYEGFNDGMVEIYGVFTSEEKARQAIAEMNAYYAEYEEVELDKLM